MRRRRSSGMDDEAEVDLTPMLDVVFIMLIFFIVTPRSSRKSGSISISPTVVTPLRRWLRTRTS